MGILVGLVGSAVVVDQIQRAEINAWEYSNATDIIRGDCRLSTYAASILSDRVISNREYWRLQDMAKAVDLADARSKINGESLRQCPARR